MDARRARRSPRRLARARGHPHLRRLPRGVHPRPRHRQRRVRPALPRLSPARWRRRRDRVTPALAARVGLPRRRGLRCSRA
ncbi:MAG TPA: hypothetical protein DEF51_18165 [Myxococcales bacterium]|nr:hypothetical protein [Myxococcales bacterium]